MTAIVGFGGHFPGVWRIRQNGDGNRGRHSQDLVFGLWAITEVINHYRQFARHGRGEHRQTGGK